MRFSQLPVRLGALVAATALLTSCSTAGAANSQTAVAGTPVSVVASTDVWASIVASIGGRHVDVTAIVSDAAADPHSYEASPHNQLAISKAALIIENGGGYDEFVNRMVSSTKSKANVLDAVKISGYTAKNGELNEHVWYDFPTVLAVAEKIKQALSAADPADAATFATNATAFAGRVAQLQRKEASVKAKSGGVGVAITEPVPLYMLTACGLVNLTPPAFSEAVESDNDAAPAVVAQNQALFTGKKVRALVYNEQTTGPQTEQVLAAAKSNGIPVVPVTETLPDGTVYLSRMNSNLDAIADAVAK
jgi:zinc/manganese transport system substrate-binding protein